MKSKKALDELKEDVANGNLDPYNYGTDEDGNYIYDIYGEIEMYEQEYESAPETKTLVEGRPVAGSHETENGTAENDFSGVAQMPDRSEYFLQDIFLRIRYLICQKSEKRQNLAGKSCLRTRSGLSILLSVKEKNLLRSPLGFH